LANKIRIWGEVFNLVKGENFRGESLWRGKIKNFILLE
jgi:hypothetical protein